MPGRQLKQQAPSILIKTPVQWYHQAKHILPHNTTSPINPLLSLLPNLTLHPPLQRLPLIMLQLPLLLLRLIARQTRKRATNSPANTITHTLAQIAQLTLSLLAFALGILLLASFAHTLESESAAEGLFAGADGLVPRAGGAVGVVFRDALRADGEGADVGAGLGDVFAGFGFGFLLLGLVLD
jgi:hypothetical protein